MRSTSGLFLAAVLLLALALIPAPAAAVAFPFSLTAAMSPALLPDQVPAPQPMTVCLSGDNIAYGEGPTGTAACSAATAAANADCMNVTDQSCCTVWGCTCVNGAGGFACTEHYRYRKPIN
jgi:hypothetical protein